MARAIIRLPTEVDCGGSSRENEEALCENHGRAKGIVRAVKKLHLTDFPEEDPCGIIMLLHLLKRADDPLRHLQYVRLPVPDLEYFGYGPLIQDALRAEAAVTYQLEKIAAERGLRLDPPNVGEAMQRYLQICCDHTVRIG